MQTGLRIFAYTLILTTPIQLLLVIWGSFIVLTTDYGVLTLTHKAFFVDYMPVFMVVINWLYVWIWSPYLDFIFGLPLIFAQAFKALVSTWLGFWILRKTG
ncbi:MAG TPA: hypothetical protein EYQ44_07610 [Porticoccaceae bacterium]|nr:hypothetical protein [Porticoccaceae bacterium]HIG67667.1 hypothetical protein [Porticoccaceae bacterium]